MSQLNANKAQITAITTYQKFSIKITIGIAIHDINSAIKVLCFKAQFSSTNLSFSSSSALYALITE
jgi:hypothetical protein